jgi:hypothetical protein
VGAEGTVTNAIIDYFDLRSTFGALSPGQSPPKAAAAQHAAVLPQYGAVALGVLADPLLRNYIATQHFGLDAAVIATRTGFALLMAIALLPAVYKNAFDPEKPILVQLCALFASGLGWQSLFQAGATAATGTPAP